MPEQPGRGEADPCRNDAALGSEGATTAPPSAPDHTVGQRGVHRTERQRSAPKATDVVPTPAVGPYDSVRAWSEYPRGSRQSFVRVAVRTAIKLKKAKPIFVMSPTMKGIAPAASAALSA